MKNFSFVVIDDNPTNGLKTRAVANSFQNLHFLASATTYDEGLDCILEHKPDLIFLEIDPSDKDSNLSLAFINELHRYLTVVPKIIVTTKNDSLSLNAFKYGVFDYFINPIEAKELRKTIFRLDKEIAITTFSIDSNREMVIPTESVPNDLSASDVIVHPNSEFSESNDSEIIEVDDIVIATEDTTETQTADFENTANNKEVTFLQTDNSDNKPLIICVKSYGDYRYIDAKDICYLQADNNSTDIHLNTGEMITAFKTLKHFEGVMTYPFVRIHNSYIVNIEFISRIHTGNAVCHIKNTTTKLPFSKSYKENVDAIITTIASGNYLEI